MDINLDPELHNEAIQAFKESLARTNVALKDAEDHYNKAVENLRRIEEYRRSLAQRHDSLVQLLEKHGEDNVPDRILTPNTRTIQLQKAYDAADKVFAIRHEQTHLTESESSRPRVNMRAWLVEKIGETGKYQTTKDIMDLVSQSFGDTIPESTITSALTYLSQAKILQRQRLGDGSGVYGLPDWPLPDRPYLPGFNSEAS